MSNLNILVSAFLDWYKNDPHSEHEGYYEKEFTSNYFAQLTREEFVSFFKEFTDKGGGVQSGGWRKSSDLIESIESDFDGFKEKVLEAFSSNFDLESWLNWTKEVSGFGKGVASIFLNRVHKSKYVIVNDKSVAGLRKLGYEIPSGDITKQYFPIFKAETSLISQFAEFENYFQVDAFMHYIIGTTEGSELIEKLNFMDYFDLKGFGDYREKAGETYNSRDPVSDWYYDTRAKLEYLVGLLSDRINTELKINYSERPNAQKGRGRIVFKEYVLTGFSPDGAYPNGELFIKLAFHSLNNTPVFDVEIDINDKLKNNSYQENRETRREESRLRLIVNRSFPKNWESLLDNIQEHVKDLVNLYGQVTGIRKTKSSEMTNQESLNKILYGPPGTGKTYHSISHAISIVENTSIEEILEEEREEVKTRFDHYLKSGQIAFSTFHQSMGYEDFMEGIKPVEPSSEEEQLTYAVEDGVFKRLCTEASFSFVQQNTTEETEKVLDFSSAYDQYVESVNESIAKGEIIEIETRSGGKVYVDSITERNNVKIKHINGSRDYTVSKKRLSQIAQAFPDLNEVTNINDQFRGEIGGSNSSAYWAVLNAIRNNTDSGLSNRIKSKSERDYSYDDRKRIIETLKNEDYKIDNPKQYVIIIDEINRGNVSQVFGELITLIEDDKRLGGAEALKAILPYSKDSFGVPSNLHIIGTMNTADRSVEALDSALRRRFSFIHMEPEPEKLHITEDGIDLPELLKIMNKRLSILKDDDHTIGHAWLWNIKDVNQLRQVFKNKIMPLLKEYFYNDYEKLGLVLGDPFFKKHIQVDSSNFANFSGGNGLAVQYDQSWQYQIKQVEKITIDDFKTLGQAILQTPNSEE